MNRMEWDDCGVQFRRSYKQILEHQAARRWAMHQDKVYRELPMREKQTRSTITALSFGLVLILFAVAGYIAICGGE